MTTTIPTTLRCDVVKDSLGAFALGVMEPAERAPIERHLAICPRCRAELDRYETVIPVLASAVPPGDPSTALRARLVEDVRTAPRSSPAPGEIAPAVNPRRTVGLVIPRWGVAVVAAAAVLLLVGLAVAGIMLSRAQASRDDAATARRTLAQYIGSGGRVTPLTTLPDSDYGASQGRGSLVTAPGMPALVVVAGCPPSSDELRYGVWLARAGVRTPVGRLRVGEDGAGVLTLSSAQSLSGFDTIGVTLVADGSKKQDLLVGSLPALSGQPSS